MSLDKPQGWEMPITNKKTAIVAFQAPGSSQTLFYRLWRLAMMTDAPLARGDPSEDPSLTAVRLAVVQHADQMKRQQVHVDDIKRLCHVRISP